MVDVEAPPVPFNTMGFDQRLEAGFHALGFDGTRPVQGAVIPIALEGHDVVACAETGTGKTLAFAAPIIELLLSESPGYGDAARENYTRALILAPTRELAVQIEDSLVGLTYHTPVTSAAVFGGVEGRGENDLAGPRRLPRPPPGPRREDRRDGAEGEFNSLSVQ
jgi:superfamily II DNA/RNA helicase